jgi:flagellar basal body-associated protein FliL
MLISNNNFGENSAGVIQMVMRPNQKIMIIVGIILFISGIIGSFWSFYIFLPNPRDVAEASLVFDSSTSREVYLSKGSYDIWYEPVIFGFGGPSEVEITGPDGETVFRETDFLGSSESISRGGDTYRRFGKFDAEDSGDYNISVLTSSTIYITPTINLDQARMMGYSLIIVGIIGIVLFVIGITLYFIQSSKEAKEKQQQQYQQRIQQQNSGSQAKTNTKTPKMEQLEKDQQYKFDQKERQEQHKQVPDQYPQNPQYPQYPQYLQYQAQPHQYYPYYYYPQAPQPPQTSYPYPPSHYQQYPYPSYDSSHPPQQPHQPSHTHTQTQSHYTADLQARDRTKAQAEHQKSHKKTKIQ